MVTAQSVTAARITTPFQDVTAVPDPLDPGAPKRIAEQYGDQSKLRSYRAAIEMQR
jgi:hypothetical protein